MGTYIVQVTAVMEGGSRDELRERVTGRLVEASYVSTSVMEPWEAADAIAYLEDIDAGGIGGVEQWNHTAVGAAQALETLMGNALDNAHESVDSDDIAAELAEDV